MSLQISNENGIQGISTSPKIAGITATTGSGAMTITLNPTTLDFRSTTLTTGVPVTRIVSSPISLVVPSTATLGTVSTVQSRIIVLAIDNAGTVELACVNLFGGSQLDETNIINTTLIAAASNSATLYYSTTARTGVAYRVVGYIDSTQTTAGTWAQTLTVQGQGGNALSAMSSLGYGQVFVRRDASGNGTRVFGTTYYNTTGKPKFVFVGGSPNGIGAGISATVGVGMAGQIYSNASTNYQSSVGLSFVVPAGMNFIVSVVFGAVTCDTWCELG